jgi:hypothetical protein
MEKGEEIKKEASYIFREKAMQSESRSWAIRCRFVCWVGWRSS